MNRLSHPHNKLRMKEDGDDHKQSKHNALLAGNRTHPVQLRLLLAACTRNGCNSNSPAHMLGAAGISTRITQKLLIVNVWSYAGYKPEQMYSGGRPDFSGSALFLRDGGP